MQIKELSQLLGISRQMIFRLRKRGMPCDSLESAIEWRRQNLDVTQTKNWRIDGNSGVKCKPVQVNATTKAIQPHEVERIVNERTLTKIIPSRYFERVDWLAAALKEAGVPVTGKQVVKIQDSLFSAYLEEIVYGYFEIDSDFELPPPFSLRLDSTEYQGVIASLNLILNENNAAE